MTKINFDKLEQKLNEVQKRCTQRTYTIDDIQNLIEELKIQREEILNTPINKKYFKKLVATKQHTIPNAYKWRAETTVISGTITRYGKIIIDVYRSYASHYPHGYENYYTKAIYE